MSAPITAVCSLGHADAHAFALRAKHDLPSKLSAGCFFMKPLYRRNLSCAQQGSGQSSFCKTRAAGTLVSDLAGIGWDTGWAQLPRGMPQR